MASIKGISLKNLKKFKDHEGFDIYQGNICLNGINKGFWSQDSWGGPDQFDFNTKELDAIAKEFYGPNSIYDLSCLLYEILVLADYEKKYKKAVKDGFASIVIMTDGCKESCLRIPQDIDKNAVLKRCDTYIKDFENASKYKDDIKILVFTDLKDFVQ